MNDFPVVIGTALATIALVLVLCFVYFIAADNTRADWVHALNISPPFLIDAARECSCTCKAKP